jgi:hypothetical protein
MDSAGLELRGPRRNLQVQKADSKYRHLASHTGISLNEGVLGHLFENQLQLLGGRQSVIVMAPAVGLPGLIKRLGEAVSVVEDLTGGWRR